MVGIRSKFFFELKRLVWNIMQKNNFKKYVKLLYIKGLVLIVLMNGYYSAFSQVVAREPRQATIITEKDQLYQSFENYIISIKSTYPTYAAFIFSFLIF